MFASSFQLLLLRVFCCNGLMRFARSPNSSDAASRRRSRGGVMTVALGAINQSPSHLLHRSRERASKSFDEWLIKDCRPELFIINFILIKRRDTNHHNGRSLEWSCEWRWWSRSDVVIKKVLRVRCSVGCGGAEKIPISDYLLVRNRRGNRLILVQIYTTTESEV